MNISSGKIMSAQKVVLYGPEGIGKSTFAAQFPDPVFIDTEGSTKHMDVRRFDKPSSWTMLMEQVKYVRDNLDLCKTLVIDTADWAEMLCVNDVLARYDKKGVEDFGYGKGYVYVAEEFGRLLNLLEEVVSRGIHVVLTAHAKMRKFEQPDEMGSYDRWEMKLSKQAAPMVKEWADMVLFATYKTIVVKDGTGEHAKSKAQGGKRVMYTSHHSCWDAKNRHNLPDMLDFDFKKIAHCFPSGAAIAEQPPAPKKTEPVTEPVAEKPKATGKDLIEAAKAAGVPVTESNVNIPENLPKPLRDLMEEHQIPEDVIRYVVAEKGYYPFETLIENYDPNFINGALIAGWSQLLPLLQKALKEDLPF